jgi:hypothetical protein
MKIVIQSIPHDEQRYETCGDWKFDEDTLNITVSHTQDDYDFLIGIHEAVEAWLCRKRGIDEERITAFDIAFEEKRLPGNVDEPGDSVFAPYKQEHFVATNIERIIADQLGVNWSEYDKTIYSLEQDA